MPDAVSDAQTVTSENRAEFMAQRMPREAATSPEPPPAPAPAPASTEAPEDDAAPAPEPAPEPPKHKKGIETRFSELTQQRDAERQRAEAAERRAAELEAKLNPPKPTETAKPKPADFTDAFEYAEKLAEWSADKALRDRDAADAEKAAERTATEIKNAWTKRATEVEKEHPDYKEVLASSDLKVSDQVRDALMESEHGPRILYDLAQDPEMVERLGKMTVTGALRTIGRLEAKYEAAAPPAPPPAPTPAPRPKPPEPITPIRTGASGTDNKIDANGNFTGTYEEFKALSNAGKLR